MGQYRRRVSESVSLYRRRMSGSVGQYRSKRGSVVVHDIGIHLLVADRTVGSRIAEQFAAVDADTPVRSRTDRPSNDVTRQCREETHVSP